MSLRKCEAENTTNTLTSLVEIKYLQSDSLALMPEAEIQEASNEEIDSESLEDELTPGTLAILARIETFDEYFHCCGRW